MALLFLKFVPITWAVALTVIALAVPARAQEPAQPARPPAAQQPPPPQQPRPAQGQRPGQTAGQPPEQAPPAREGRTRRTPRTSRRASPRAAAGSTDANRVSRDPGPTRQELSLTATAMGGYDDNLTGGLGASPGLRQMAMASGSTGFGAAALGYFRGNLARSIRADAAGTLQYYPKYLDRPAAGASATVDGMTKLGSSTTVRASERVGYEPFFNALSTAAGTPAPLGPGPGSGSAGGTLPGGGPGSPGAELYERRSLNSTSSVGLDRRWGRSHDTSVSYSYRVQRFEDASRGDNSSHTAHLDQRARLSGAVRAHAAYRYTERDYTGWQANDLRSREHRIEAGPEVETELSRGHFFRLSLTAGAARLESTGREMGPGPISETGPGPNSGGGRGYEEWVPVGSANATLGLSPSWSLGGGYRRDFSLLWGVTDEIYATDTAFATLGGLLTTRIDLQMGGTYATWRTPLASGADDTFDVYGGSLQLRVMLTRKLAATTSYNYYHHRYSNPGALPAGFPAKFDRHAVRAGLTLMLPLAGASPQRPRM